MSSLERSSGESERGRDVPSFIEARPPLVKAPWMRPKPVLATNLMNLYEDESLGEEEGSDLVQVYLRMKPSAEANTLYDVRSDTVLVASTDTLPSDCGRRTQCNASKEYTFSHIFRSDSTQKQIFEHAVKGDLRKLTEGHSFTLLTYGPSGSGKTYTLMGTVEQPGLVPRSLEYIFKLVSPAQHPLYRPHDADFELLTPAQQAHELELVSRLRRATPPARSARRMYRRMSHRLSGDFHSLKSVANHNTHYIWVSFFEIYNEAVYDLLQRPDRTKPVTRLKIYEDPRGTVYVKGATQAFVRTGAEAYDVMSAGKQNLHVAATGVHAHSSRSHCIFTITLLSETPEGVESSCVRLCDLAGSERAERTRNEGVRMAESRAINSSLHVLERCISMLRRKQRAANTTDAGAVVPFRESKLTRLLGAPLSGASREAVSMVVTVNPSPLYAQETRHVLKLAAVASNICVNTTSVEGLTLETTAVDNTYITRDSELITLRAENERLLFEIERLYARLEEMSNAAASTREQSAATMEELVKEAKESSRHYYTQQMSLQDARHRREKERLLALVVENVALKEQLKEQPLERALAESELAHLHACIAERDRDTREMGDASSEPSDPIVILELESDTSSSEDDDDSDCDNENVPLSAITEESTVDSARSTADRGDDCPDDNYTSKLILDDTNDNVARAMTQDETDDEGHSAMNEDLDRESDEEMEIQITSIPSKSSNTAAADADMRASDIDSSKCDLACNTSQQNNTQQGAQDTTIDRGDDISTSKLTHDHCGSLVTRETIQDTANLTGNSAKNHDLDSESDEEMEIHITSIPSKISNTAAADADMRASDIDSSKCDLACNTSQQNNTQQGAQDTTNDADFEETIQNKSFRLADRDMSGNSSPIKHSNKNEKELNAHTKIAPEHDVSTGIKEHLKIQTQPTTELPVNKIEGYGIKIEKTSIDPVQSEENEMFPYLVPVYNYVPISESTSQNICLTAKPGDGNTLGSCTLDSISLSNMTDQNVKTETVANQKSLFNNAVEIMLTEHKPTCKDLIKEVDRVGMFNTALDDIQTNGDTLTFGSQINVTDFNNGHQTTNEIQNYEGHHFGSARNINSDGILSMCCPKSEVWVTGNNRKALQKDCQNICNIAEQVRSDNSAIENIHFKKSHNSHQRDGDTKVNELDNRVINTAVSDEISPSIMEDLESRASNLKIINPKSFNGSDDKMKKSEHSATNEEESPHSNPWAEQYHMYLEPESAFPSLSKDIGSVIGKIDFSSKFKQELSEEDPPLEEGARVEETNRKSKSCKYNLRLRKKDSSYESVKSDQKEEATCLSGERTSKLWSQNNSCKRLRNIANLQLEFSDVTTGAPNCNKVVPDIPSPEKRAGEENVPPTTVMSCPGKSARSRRKLWTPRAEPLDESVASDDDGNLRVRIPRPSYHRSTRARRKLQH